MFVSGGKAHDHSPKVHFQKWCLFDHCFKVVYTLDSCSKYRQEDILQYESNNRRPKRKVGMANLSCVCAHPPAAKHSPRTPSQDLTTPVLCKTITCFNPGTWASLYFSQNRTGCAVEQTTPQNPPYLSIAGEWEAILYIIFTL